MPTIATDGKGNYVALDANGNWVPTAAPAPAQQGGGELGYQPAPPAAKPATLDQSGGYVSPEGAYVPPQAIPGVTPSPTAAPVVAPNVQAAPPQPLKIDDSTLQLFPKPPTTGTPILDAAREGAAGAPDASGWAPGGVQLGKYIVNPALEAAGAVFRGGQEAVSQAVGQINPQLGRDVAALPEAFPTGVEGPLEPPTAAAARNKLNRPVTMEDLRGAIGRSDAAAAADQPSPPANRLGPDAGGPSPQSPPSSAQTGTTAQGQFLNGDWVRSAGKTEQGFDMGKGADAVTGQVRDALARGDTVQLVTDKGGKTVGITGINSQGMMVDAQGQPWGTAPFAFDGTGREGVRITPSGPQPTHVYTSADHDYPVTPTGAEGTYKDGRVYAEVRTPDGATSWVPKDQLVAKSTTQPQGAQPAGAGGPQPAGGPSQQPPPAAPVDPPIMSQADIQARGRGYFNAADQAASQGAVLPDTNAAAVRKLFGDFIPSDTEAARISAGEPAMQAAKNVDATGPMSYDTAMRIDRDLTARMRGASGTDAHDLSQLQQGLRDQMDQVPDLEHLRPGRQAWRQSIKQGQMEDINAGAALKNDPAQADTYVRQRAAALLKNDNAMRYWTPEEKEQLTQVAKSGDIGMLGRLSTALIKPVTRIALGAVGHSVAGPLGAIVGAEVGGDVGATQAGRLRSYLSKTTLDPVMRQITRGVPPPYTPPNRLGPQAP